MWDFFLGLTPYWYWLIAAFVLMLLEIVVPGVFLLWFGLAALVSSVFAFFVPDRPDIQGVIFAVFAGLFLWLGRKFYARSKEETTHPKLNKRGAQYVGRKGIVSEAVSNGMGKVKLDDTVWSALSDDALAAGTPVEVTAVEGTKLVIKKV